MELSDGTRVCIDCENLFIIDDGERAYLADRGYQLPKRCKACRALRKDIAHQADVDRARETLGVTDETIQKQNEMIVLLALMDEI